MIWNDHEGVDLPRTLAGRVGDCLEKLFLASRVRDHRMLVMSRER